MGLDFSNFDKSTPYDVFGPQREPLDQQADDPYGLRDLYQGIDASNMGPGYTPESHSMFINNMTKRRLVQGDVPLEETEFTQPTHNFMLLQDGSEVKLTPPEVEQDFQLVEPEERGFFESAFTSLVEPFGNFSTALDVIDKDLGVATQDLFAVPVGALVERMVSAREGEEAGQKAAQEFKDEFGDRLVEKRDEAVLQRQDFLQRYQKRDGELFSRTPGFMVDLSKWFLAPVLLTDVAARTYADGIKVGVEQDRTTAAGLAAVNVAYHYGILRLFKFMGAQAQPLLEKFFIQGAKDMTAKEAAQMMVQLSTTAAKSGALGATLEVGNGTLQDLILAEERTAATAQLYLSENLRDSPKHFGVYAAFSTIPMAVKAYSGRMQYMKVQQELQRMRAHYRTQGQQGEMLDVAAAISALENVQSQIIRDTIMARSLTDASSLSGSQLAALRNTLARQAGLKPGGVVGTVHRAETTLPDGTRPQMFERGPLTGYERQAAREIIRQLDKEILRRGLRPQSMQPRPELPPLETAQLPAPVGQLPPPMQGTPPPATSMPPPGAVGGLSRPVPVREAGRPDMAVSGTVEGTLPANMASGAPTQDLPQFAYWSRLSPDSRTYFQGGPEPSVPGEPAPIDSTPRPYTPEEIEAMRQNPLLDDEFIAAAEAGTELKTPAPRTPKPLTAKAEGILAEVMMDAGTSGLVPGDPAFDLLLGKAKDIIRSLPTTSFGQQTNVVYGNTQISVEQLRDINTINLADPKSESAGLLRDIMLAEFGVEVEVTTPAKKPKAKKPEPPKPDVVKVYRGGEVDPDSALTYSTETLSEAEKYGAATEGAVQTFELEKNKIASEQVVLDTLAELGFPQVKPGSEEYAGGMIHEFLDPNFRGQGFYLGDGVDAQLAEALKEKGFDAYRATGTSGDGSKTNVEEIVITNKDALRKPADPKEIGKVKRRRDAGIELSESELQLLVDNELPLDPQQVTPAERRAYRAGVREATEKARIARTEQLEKQRAEATETRARNREQREEAALKAQIRLEEQKARSDARLAEQKAKTAEVRQDRKDSADAFTLVRGEIDKLLTKNGLSTKENNSIRGRVLRMLPKETATADKVLEKGIEAVQKTAILVETELWKVNTKDWAEAVGKVQKEEIHPDLVPLFEQAMFGNRINPLSTNVKNSAEDTMKWARDNGKTGDERLDASFDQARNAYLNSQPDVDLLALDPKQQPLDVLHSNRIAKIEAAEQIDDLLAVNKELQEAEAAKKVAEDTRRDLRITSEIRTSPLKDRKVDTETGEVGGDLVGGLGLRDMSPQDLAIRMAGEESEIAQTVNGFIVASSGVRGRQRDDGRAFVEFADTAGFPIERLAEYHPSYQPGLLGSLVNGFRQTRSIGLNFENERVVMNPMELVHLYTTIRDQSGFREIIVNGAPIEIVRKGQTIKSVELTSNDVAVIVEQMNILEQLGLKPRELSDFLLSMSDETSQMHEVRVAAGQRLEQSELGLTFFPRRRGDILGDGKRRTQQDVQQELTNGGQSLTDLSSTQAQRSGTKKRGIVITDGLSFISRRATENYVHHEMAPNANVLYGLFNSRSSSSTRRAMDGKKGGSRYADNMANQVVGEVADVLGYRIGGDTPYLSEILRSLNRGVSATRLVSPTTAVKQAGSYPLAFGDQPGLIPSRYKNSTYANPFTGGVPEAGRALFVNSQNETYERMINGSGLLWARFSQNTLNVGVGYDAGASTTSAYVNDVELTEAALAMMRSVDRHTIVQIWSSAEQWTLDSLVTYAETGDKSAAVGHFGMDQSGTFDRLLNDLGARGIEITPSGIRRNGRQILEHPLFQSATNERALPTISKTQPMPNPVSASPSLFNARMNPAIQMMMPFRAALTKMYSQLMSNPTSLNNIKNVLTAAFTTVAMATIFKRLVDESMNQAKKLGGIPIPEDEEVDWNPRTIAGELVVGVVETGGAMVPGIPGALMNAPGTLRSGTIDVLEDAELIPQGAIRDYGRSEKPAQAFLELVSDLPEDAVQILRKAMRGEKISDKEGLDLAVATALLLMSVGNKSTKEVATTALQANNLWNSLIRTRYPEVSVGDMTEEDFKRATDDFMDEIRKEIRRYENDKKKDLPK